MSQPSNRLNKHRINSNEPSIDYEEYKEYLNESKDESKFEIHLNEEEKIPYALRIFVLRFISIFGSFTI